MSSGRIRKYFVMSSGAPGPEKHVGEKWIHQRVRIAARAVQQQHCIIGMARGIAVRSAQRQVV